MNIAYEIEHRLRERLEATRVEIEDESHRHAGHAGARGGSGGHFQVVVLSERFKGLPTLRQHRLVYQALEDLMGTAIHALALKTGVPEQSQPKLPDR